MTDSILLRLPLFAQRVSVRVHPSPAATFVKNRGRLLRRGSLAFASRAAASLADRLHSHRIAFVDGNPGVLSKALPVLARIAASARTCIPIF